MVEAVVRAGPQHALGDALAAFDDPGHVEQRFAGFGLELAPQLVRPTEQWDVVGVLEVGEADDPGEAVRRAVFVEQVEALEPEHALASSSKVIEGRAPHSPDSDDHDVVPLHRT